MRKTVFLVLVILTILIQTSVSQTIYFTKTDHDFGTIKDIDGIVSYNFKFSNTGTSALTISGIVPSSSSVSASSTKTTLNQGEEAYITVNFDPTNRPGNFNKTIIVKSNASNGNAFLRINGDVISSQTLEDMHPYEVGQLQFQKMNISLSVLYNNQTKTAECSVYNPSNKALKLSFKYLPSYLKLTVDQQIIYPKQTAIVTATVTGSLVNDYGFIKENIKPYIDGVEAPREISISFILKEYFTLEQKNNPPIFQVEEKILNFGTIKVGETIEHNFHFTNTGVSDLIIRKATSNSSGLTITYPQGAIKPGASGNIKVVYEATGAGRQNKVISVIVNVPTNDSCILRMTGTVVR